MNLPLPTGPIAQAVGWALIHLLWQGTLVAVKGSGGVSAARSEAEGTYAWSWAKTIWADSLT